jgi:hypothetical protein
MTKGALIFAQNNGEIDYVKIAIFAAKRVKEYLGIPVSLVTDSKTWLYQSDVNPTDIFDQIIDISDNTDFIKSQNRSFHDGTVTRKILKWKNFSRSDCYDLSPYDETLVLDSDYIVCSDNLKNIWDNAYDFAIYKEAYDLSRWRTPYTYINQYSVPFYWATVFYFKKTNETAAFFELVKHIKSNWNYYRTLYNIDSITYRNDFSFSIAINILAGGDISTNFVGSLPSKLYYTVDKDVVDSIDRNQTKVLVEKEFFPGEYVALKTSGIDVHLMNKYSLSRAIDNYEKEAT